MRRNRKGVDNPTLQVLIQPNIELDIDSHQAVIRILNTTLADETVLSIKTRCAVWNVRGSGFSNRHAFFAAQYRQLNNICDEISKRVQELGGQTICSFEEFLNKNRLEEQPGVTPYILSLLADHEAMIRYLREDAKKSSEEYEDEGTKILLVGVIRLHEKMAWMLRSFIAPDLSGNEIRANKILPNQP